MWLRWLTIKHFGATAPTFVLSFVGVFDFREEFLTGFPPNFEAISTQFGRMKLKTELYLLSKADLIFALWSLTWVIRFDFKKNSREGRPNGKLSKVASFPLGNKMTAIRPGNHNYKRRIFFNCLCANYRDTTELEFLTKWIWINKLLR